MLRELLRSGEIGNLGARNRPRYVLREHYRPLELAYERIVDLTRVTPPKLLSKTQLKKSLKQPLLGHADEALALLVKERRLLQLRWGNTLLYLAAPTAAPQPDGSADQVSWARISVAYRQTVEEFGYADVLIHEVHVRLGGALETLLNALKAGISQGKVITSVGDWSLSSEQERAAALYVNGRPHLRVRLIG